jgi:hypothetical protein
MDSAVSYADLWAPLRRLGYDCDRLTDDNQLRVCQHAAARSRLTQPQTRGPTR